jgi:DNA repair exonuclease SbcCD ATPase subunit
VTKLLTFTKQTKVKKMIIHKHYNLAYNAHRNTSFSPDKRAEAYCKDFDNMVETLKSYSVSQEQIDKFENLWVVWLDKKSRCLSPMITGPANFPTNRNEKANASENKACEKVDEYYNKLIEAAKAEEYYKKNPDARPIKSDDDDAIERYQQKLERLKHYQELMKKFNSAIRKKGATLESVQAEVPELADNAAELMQPDSLNRCGFASFELTNNNAKIKDVENRIKELESRKEQGRQEIEVAGVKVIQNPDAHRLQLFFDGKPDTVIITLLKRCAFKWSPKNGCWQRQLTNNALFDFKHTIRPALENA